MTVLLATPPEFSFLALESSSTLESEGVTLDPYPELPPWMLHCALVLSESRLAQGLKRILDCVAALGLLALLSPLLLLTALAVKLAYGNTLFTRQDCVGLHCRVFGRYRFRTATLLDDGQANAFDSYAPGACQNRLGRFLCRTRLHRLPELFNLLKGDIALIGPSAETPYWVRHYRGQRLYGYSHRHTVRPGLTGYAQTVCPKGTRLGLKDRTLLDNDYITHWSPLLDAWIALRSLKRLLTSAP